jgi:hypothetical protein
MIVWCVQHSEGWCAVKGNEKFEEDDTSVETVCEHFVSLPTGCEKRKPTCPTCRTAIIPKAIKQQRSRR